jgi:3-oxoacyl-[acyl-carrier protein] reductase
MTDQPHDRTSQAPFGGRVALLTGASGGIGVALARRLAEAGADLVLTYASHREPAEDAARQARDRGRRALVVEGDLEDPAAPDKLVAEAESRLGPVEVLVANAGVGERRSWEDVDVALWDATLAVNLRAPFLLARRTLPGMVRRGFGRVLFTSSIAAFNGGVIGPHYAASKAALHGLIHHLAPRVAGDGVTVNGIAPALIGGTRMLPVDPAQADTSPLPIPVGRLGSPEEVADLSLAILRNGYLTNKVIPVDGGMYAA